MLILKKFILANKNKVLALLLFLGTIFLFISYETIGLHNTKQTNIESVTNSNIISSRESINELNKNLKEEMTSEEREITNSLLTEAKQNLKTEESKLVAIKNKDYDRYYELVYQTNLSIQEQINKNASDKEQPAIYANDNYLDSYNSWYEQVKKSGQKFSEALGSNSSGIGALNYILSVIGGIFGLVLLTFLCGDVLSNEFPNGLRYFHLIKKSRNKIQNQYLLIPILTVMIFLVVLLFIVFLVVSLQYGVGAWHFPQFIIGAQFQYYAGYVLIWRILYLMAFLFFITTLGQLISQIIKKPYIPSAVITLILVGYSLIQSQDFMRSFIKWIPLTYLNVNTVFNLSNGEKSWPDSGNYLFRF